MIFDKEQEGRNGSLCRSKTEHETGSESVLALNPGIKTGTSPENSRTSVLTD